MKNKRRKRYAGISSLQELQQERAKLDVLIKHQEYELLDDVERVRDYFSFENLGEVAIEKIYSWFPQLHSVIIGFKAVRSMIFRRRSTGCGCE